MPHLPSFIGRLPTPRFYPNSARPLNMFLWMPRQERSVAAFRGRILTRDASRRRGQPRVIAGSVSAGVNLRLGLARGRMAARIPGVPPRSAAHPPLAMHGRPSRPKKSGVSFPLLLSSHLSVLASLRSRTVGLPGRRKVVTKRVSNATRCPPPPSSSPPPTS
jgi:hypothetical protein